MFCLEQFTQEHFCFCIWIAKQISIHFSLKVRNIKKEINTHTTKTIHGGISLSLVNMSVSVSCDFCFLIPVRPEHFSCTVQQAVHSPESQVQDVVPVRPWVLLYLLWTCGFTGLPNAKCYWTKTYAFFVSVQFYCYEALMQILLIADSKINKKLSEITVK